MQSKIITPQLSPEDKMKKENIFKYIVYLLIVVGAFAIVRYVATPKPVDTESNKNITIFMQNAIDEIDQSLKKDSSDEDMTTLLSWHKSNAALYNDAKVFKDDSIKQKSNTLKDRIVKVQTRDFPDLRSAFVNSKKEAFLKENVQITSSGTTNDILTFTGAMFKPANTKKEFLKGIDQIVKDLRFKKVVFKWSDSKDDFTDYKIKSKNDSEI